eukprot:Pgem_evm1s12914
MDMRLVLDPCSDNSNSYEPEYETSSQDHMRNEAPPYDAKDSYNNQREGMSQ